MHRLIAAALATLWTGSAAAGSIGWFAFLQETNQPQQPELVAAELKSDGTAHVFARFGAFGRGTLPDAVDVSHIAMGPKGDFVAVHFVTADALAEHYTAMIFTKYGERVDQFDDLGFSTGISTLCGVTGAVVQPYINAALQDAADGVTSPTVTGARLDYVDTDGNYLRLSRWLDDTSVELEGRVAMNLTYLDTAGPDIPMGVIASVPIHLRVSRVRRDYFAPWRATACRATAFGASIPASPDTTVHLVPQPAGTQTVAWKGVPILQQNGASVVQTTATHVTGPYEPDIR